MAQVTEDQVLTALRTVIDPERGTDIVSLGMIAGLTIQDDAVTVAIKVDPERGAQAEPIRHAAEIAVKRLGGAGSVTAVLTAHRRPSAMPARGATPGHSHAHSPGYGHSHGHGPGQSGPGPARPALTGVHAVIAVASGKGGVGKSTTAVNLALALVGLGLRVGLLDADVYGPSLPRLLAITEKPRAAGERLAPIVRHGLATMSMGFLVAEDTPMIWRGPMVQSALQQMLFDVAWGPLDILVVDMPPGTGDAQLTMAQQVPLAGAVIVSTPQDLALLDARKGLNMFRRVDVPVLGIIENMSYFKCPHCGGRSDIFSHGGARREAERLGVDFLGEIPLDMVIRETSDQGRPIIVAEPEGDHARAFGAIAARLWQRLAAGAPHPAPRIVVD
jgi:ATP-binding protein involved in chromosome partitioning